MSLGWSKILKLTFGEFSILGGNIQGQYLLFNTLVVNMWGKYLVLMW